MINLCLVVIATQFSETKKREMEKMLTERRRQHQQHSSSSTLASGSDLQPGDCYEEMLKYAGHLVRKSRRHVSRFARRRQLAAAARRQANQESTQGDANVNADTSEVVISSRGRKSSLETRPLRVAVFEVDDAPENDESQPALPQDQPSCQSLSSATARRPSSLQIDSSSNSSSLRNSPAFASIVSLVGRTSLPSLTVDSRKCSVMSQATIDTPPTQALADNATVQYLVLPLEVIGDNPRCSSSTPSPNPSLAVDYVAHRPSSSASTSKRGSVQFVDTVKTCVHRTSSVGHTRPPQSLLVRKASVLSSGGNVEDHRRTSSLSKSASFNSARCGREKCCRFSPETEMSRLAVDNDAQRHYEDATNGQLRRASGTSLSTSSTVRPTSPNFLEVPAHEDIPTYPPRRVASVGRAASLGEVEVLQQRTHRPCVMSLSVPSSTPVTATFQPPVPASAAVVRSDQQHRRSFRANNRRMSSVQHRAVRRAVSCRTATRPIRKSSATVGRASSLNEGARGRRMAAETAASIGSLGLFGSDFLFCSQTRMSSTADIYRRMQQRARLNAALSSDSGMSSCLLQYYISFIYTGWVIKTGLFLGICNFLNYEIKTK